MAQRRGLNVDDPGFVGPVSPYVPMPVWMLVELAKLGTARLGRAVLVWNALWSLRRKLSDTDPMWRGVHMAWPGRERIADDSGFGGDGVGRDGKATKDAPGVRSVTAGLADLQAVHAISVVPWERDDGSHTSAVYVLWQRELGWTDYPDADNPGVVTRIRDEREVPLDLLRAVRPHGRPVDAGKVAARRRKHAEATARRDAGPAVTKAVTSDFVL